VTGMSDDIELVKRRFDREKLIRRQAEKIAEEKSRELYFKGVELQKALEAESQARKEIEILYREVERLSRIDPLTEVLNRRSFGVEAHRLFQLAIRHRKTLSCAMLDIDFFKRVNDNHGHDAGDKVLIAVAKACEKEIRRTDLLARFGGEEFCFLFPETALDGAANLSERIRQAISMLEFGSDDAQFSVTVSIGVSDLAGADDDLENMLKRSDEYLYKAKTSGRNRVVVAES
jgi:diguanylate cyclase (GGDEF)-like protein